MIYQFAAHGATAGSIPRVFYLSPSGTLTRSSLDLGTEPKNASLASQPISFAFPNQLLPPPFATVSGRMIFSLYMKANQSSSITLEGTFNESLGAGNLAQSSTDKTNTLTKVAKAYNFTYNLQSQPLVVQSSISVSIRLTSSSPKTNVTLLYGSTSFPSYIVLPMAGYIVLNSSLYGLPIAIIDPQSHNPSTSFDLNSTFRAITFEVFVDSALGFDDIDQVNLTIVDPSNQPVFSLPMNPSPLSSPYEFSLTWPYPANATQGAYQAWVDILDIQKNRAYSLHGSATFGLSRTSPLARAALNLLPYIGISGLVIAGGAFYYRRRKTKSYFAPFEYFNTLTGGELNGGSAVTIEGNTGSGKTLLTEQLMFEDLKKGRPCVFLATGDFPSSVRSNMKAMGLDVTGYEQNGLLKFVDGYSSEAGQESREKISVPSLGDLTTLGMKISSSLPDESFKGGSLYFDSLTPLASKAKPENIVSFVQSVGARVKGLGGKAFFTLGPSVDPVVQRQLEEMADCVVQMEAFEEGGVRKSRLRISKLRARRHQQGWVIYTIEDGKGIIFYSKNPKQ